MERPAPIEGVPRKPREDVEGAVHHVYARGNRREDIYVDDVDRRTYLSLLAGVVRSCGWRCLMYCLMDNHVHLLIETPRANLAAGMQRLHSVYAQRFNARHDRCGHLFQGRYGSVRITGDEQMWAVAAYIAGNPVEAGLCQRPEEWRWSSHRVIAGMRVAPRWLHIDRLLWFFGGLGGAARKQYLAVVDGRLVAKRAALPAAHQAPPSHNGDRRLSE